MHLTSKSKSKSKFGEKKRCSTPGSGRDNRYEDKQASAETESSRINNQESRIENRGCGDTRGRGTEYEGMAELGETRNEGSISRCAYGRQLVERPRIGYMYWVRVRVQQAVHVRVVMESVMSSNAPSHFGCSLAVHVFCDWIRIT